MQPQLTGSGYRGIWGTTLTPEIARSFTQAFSHFIQARHGKKILIGRDARPSGEELVKVVSETLRDAGFEVTIGGLLPTPTVLFLVREMKFDGAVIITASHNPPEYNGLKFVTSRGMFTHEADVAEIKSYIGKELPVTQGSIASNTELGEKHVAHILEKIDRDLIRSKKFKVVLDPINSAGAILGPKLLQELGCEITVINDEPNGVFAHLPEPLAVNLTGLAEAVKNTEATVGFAQDPDADRLVLCDEKGEIIFEEYGIACCIQSALERTPGDITINLSTSKTSELLAQKYGGKTYRSKVGESNVVEKLLATHCVVGGEGSGGIIYPEINPCRDSLTGIALILELLARHNETTLSSIVSKLPQLVMRKDKFPRTGELAPLYEKIQSYFPEATVDTQDGLRLDFADNSWINIRPSNTEPIVRVMGEAETSERIETLMKQVKELLG